jgi:hypothetical protein
MKVPGNWGEFRNHVKNKNVYIPTLFAKRGN